jgi:aryl-alcohol dehydrogenase-like predicted oxidoreductase
MGRWNGISKHIDTYLCDSFRYDTQAAPNSAGKIKAIADRHLRMPLSRPSRRICHGPRDAVQVEYSPWDLDIENARGTHLLAACRELGVNDFCYSPLGRGFPTGRFRSRDQVSSDDHRLIVPRFNEENFDKNPAMVDKFATMTERKGCTLSQLVLAWLLARVGDIVPTPGTKKMKYLEENIGAAKVSLSEREVREIRAQLGKMDEVKTGSRFAGQLPIR